MAAESPMITALISCLVPQSCKKFKMLRFSSTSYVAGCLSPIILQLQLLLMGLRLNCSLAVHDLSNLVKDEDIISSEHLLTLLAIVPKYSQKDWLASYETLSSYVVPRSSKKLYEDNEYALYPVVLFRQVADNFRTSAREKGFQIRDYEHSSEAQESRKQELERLMQDQDSLRNSLLQWCYTNYGEVANLAGYVVGPSGINWLHSRFLVKDGVPVLAAMFVIFYVGTKDDVLFRISSHQEDASYASRTL